MSDGSPDICPKHQVGSKVVFERYVIDGEKMRVETPPPILGEVKFTERGFEIIEFSDIYGEKCSLQASSMAGTFWPGTAAVWLGCLEAKNHPNGEPIAPRMHLGRKEVVALIEHLQMWLNAGTFRTTQKPGSEDLTIGGGPCQ